MFRFRPDPERVDVLTHPPGARLVLSLAGCLSVILVLVCAGTANAAAPTSARRAAAVALAAPSPGDIS